MDEILSGDHSNGIFLQYFCIISLYSWVLKGYKGQPSLGASADSGQSRATGIFTTAFHNESLQVCIILCESHAKATPMSLKIYAKQQSFMKLKECINQRTHARIRQRLQLYTSSRRYKHTRNVGVRCGIAENWFYLFSILFRTRY